MRTSTPVSKKLLARSTVTERRGSITVLLSGAVVVALAQAVWSRRWMADDGFINLRVVDQLVAGHGPVFNAGERVEPTTSALWAWLLALGDVVLPMRLEWIAVLLGLVLMVAGMAAILLGAVLLLRRAGEEGVLLPLGALTIAVIPAVWDFGTSGLEGGLIAAWLGACFLAMVRQAAASRPGSAPPTWLSVLVGIGPLVRPDFILFSVPFVAALVLGHPKGSRLRTVLSALAVPLAYEVFRAGYYAALVPNTAFAKEGGKARWGQGWDYLTDFFGSYWLLVPLAALAVGAVVPLWRRLWREPDRRLVLVVSGFLVGAALDGLYVVRVGGSHMHGRLLLPSLIAILAPVAVVPFRRGALVGVVVASWAVVCLLALRPDESYDVRHQTVARTGSAHPVNIYWHARGLATVEPWSSAEGPFMPALDFLGARAYHAGTSVYVLDMLGLGDWLTGRMEITAPGSIDHEKPLPYQWVIARALAVSGEVPPRILATQPAAEVHAAQQALRCGEIREVQRAVSERLTPGRFLTNVGTSVRLHSTRFPPEPEVARRKLC